jgi:DNA-binding winged helix-turn-helix (wHTH) protein
MPRYRFSDFVVSPRRRTLVRSGRELPLIPRYFDLLVFLVEHRHEAVHRRDIFDRVWSDVVVSDSALSQAVRTLRRTLGDDSREPRFIRTVSRHGYRFVFGDVVEEEDDDSWPGAEPPAPRQQPLDESGDRFEPLLARLAGTHATEEERRDVAELLHVLGTGEALRRLGTRPRHASARAMLRDTRWDVAEAGPVPIVGRPAPLAVAAALVRLRLRRAAGIAAGRWGSASLGGGLAGALAGTIGGAILAAVPDGVASLAVIPVLAVIGGCCGAAGGAGVGAGLALAESGIGRWSLATLVGIRIGIGGGLAGLVIGAATGLSYALTTSDGSGGLAAPRGRRRLIAATVSAAACGLGALALTLAGRPLVGGTIHAIAQATEGAQMMLTPLGQLIGEPDFGPLSRAVLGTGEGALFGLGFMLGLTRRH